MRLLCVQIYIAAVGHTCQGLADHFESQSLV